MICELSCLNDSRKRQQVDLPKEMTAIWSRTNKECNAWMEEQLRFLIQPITGGA
ncbi:cold-inducible protein YdjO-related protein [Paenibacillus vini]|uniref:cold-inducible protein YdjO-related protein n=1 Tax=Paenibacillus TaxID=44249 RepID=UPI003390298D